MGRHKIPIKKIDKENDRDVCFSKRRKGLFIKATKLARAGSEVAIIIFSRAGNAFTFSHPSIESIADRFLSQEIIKADNFHGIADIVARGFDVARGGLTGTSEEGETSNKGDKLDGGDTIMQDKGLKSDHESETSSEAEGPDITGGLMHDGEHATGRESSTEETLHGSRFWWNKRIDNLESHELVEFQSALEQLREKVQDRANQILVEKPVFGHSFDFSKYKFKFPE